MRIRASPCSTGRLGGPGRAWTGRLIRRPEISFTLKGLLYRILPKRHPMPPADLPDTFTYSEARKAGLSKHALYRLRDSGQLEPIGRGLYRRHDAPLGDVDLLAVAQRSPMATLCLTSALARHDLTDLIPARHDIALPRGTWHPRGHITIHWHSFDPSTFRVGREMIALDKDTRIGLYNAERSIVDAFRFRSQLGIETAHEALRRWLRAGGSPADLLQMSRTFPRTQTAIRSALEILT